MVIDFHTHILPSSFRGRGEELRARDATFALLFARENAPMATAAELVAAMDVDGVEASAVLGYGWCDPEIARESNDYLLEAARRFPGRLIPFCSVNPEWGKVALAEVERCISQGAAGIGELHPTSQGVDLAKGPSLDGLMALAQEAQLPVLVHGSEPVGHAYPGKGDTTPGELMAFITRYPMATIICAHWGGGLPFYSLMPEVRAALANVYFDTAVSPLLYNEAVFPVAVQAAGAEHVLFGSDYPLVRARRVIAQATASLGGEVAEAVLHGNAERLLKGSR